jgi:hypothetical protein
MKEIDKQESIERYYKYIHQIIDEYVNCKISTIKSVKNIKKNMMINIFNIILTNYNHNLFEKDIEL